MKEKLQNATVDYSHRATLRCKFSTNSRTVRVSRFDSGRDPNAVTVAWSDGLTIDGNYRKAVREYTSQLNWGGRWVVSMITDGAVAVCLDAVLFAYDAENN